ncbi:MAG: hypothetical protein HFI12_01585 [Lachnospiraceae bacterium]|nr:hypothetical protein [Lachnospiraceae bacterium]
MDKYEYLLKVDQIEKLMKKKDYQMAVQIADTIDWRRIKNLNVLYAVSEAYEKAERYEDCMEILSIAYDRAPVGRLVLYKMTEIAIRMGNLDEAIALYQDFVKVAPHDQSRFILKYQIYRDRKYSLEDQIKVLKEYKTHEYQEKWAYELASLYAQAGMEKECVQECDELILWFSEGEYVAKALELKQQYEPLTASQQMKYQQAQNPSYQEEISFEEDRFSTADLQAELAANVGELLLENATIEIPELEEEKKSKQRTSKIEIEELVFPGKSPEPEAVPEPVLEIGLEEFTLPEEDTQKPEEESAIELEDFTMPGIIHSQEDEEPEIIMEELTLGNEEEPVEPEEPEVVVEEFSLEEEEVSQSEEPEPELEITMEELTLGDEEEPIEPEEALEVVVEDFSLEEEEDSQLAEPEPELEITMEEITLGDEEEPVEPELEIIMEELTLETEEESVEPEEAPEVVVEDFLLEEEEISQPDEAEPESEITMEEMILGDEEEAVEPEEEPEVMMEDFSLEEEEISQSEEPEPELEIAMEELTLETEEESVEPEEVPEVVVEEVSQPDEAEPESEITMEEMTLGDEEEPKEAETIHGILAKWEDKIAAAEAVLEAKAEQEQERKEKVKQETVELMKLISGISEEIPKDVQEILEEFDKKEKPEKEEKEEPPQSKPEAKKEEEILAIEELKSEPTLLKREKLSGDTASMNMIQELERALATEVSQKAVDAGHLTIEQVRLFDYFTAVRGMSEQLSMLFKGNPRSEMTTSSSGNLVVTGEPGNGKTTLAIDIVKALQKQNQMEGSKLAKITGKRLNTKDIYEVLASLKGGALIIERAGGISEATMMALSLAMETDTGGLLVILEDTSEEIAKLFHKNKNFASKFEYTIDIPVFTNDELVAFGKSYALEQEYTFDEFALLALYGEIGSRQTNDHMVTVAEVKEIIDAAIEHAKKGSIRHLIERVTKKSQDEYGNKLLREADFED